MRRPLLILIPVILVGLLSVGCGQPAAGKFDSSQYSGRLDEVTLKIPTIACTGCRSRVETSARKVTGVVDVRFSEESIQQMTIVYDPDITRPAAIKAAIEKGGDTVLEPSE